MVPVDSRHNDDIWTLYGIEFSLQSFSYLYMLYIKLMSWHFRVCSCIYISEVKGEVYILFPLTYTYTSEHCYSLWPLTFYGFQLFNIHYIYILYSLQILNWVLLYRCFYGPVVHVYDSCSILECWGGGGGSLQQTYRLNLISGNISCY